MYRTYTGAAHLQETTVSARCSQALPHLLNRLPAHCTSSLNISVLVICRGPCISLLLLCSLDLLVMDPPSNALAVEGMCTRCFDCTKLWTQGVSEVSRGGCDPKQNSHTILLAWNIKTGRYSPNGSSSSKGHMHMQQSSCGTLCSLTKSLQIESTSKSTGSPFISCAFSTCVQCASWWRMIPAGYAWCWWTWSTHASNKFMVPHKELLKLMQSLLRKTSSISERAWCRFLGIILVQLDV